MIDVFTTSKKVNIMTVFKQGRIFLIKFFSFLICLCFIGFCVSFIAGNGNKAYAENAKELSISSVSFIGNENDKIGLYRITLADEMESVASVAFATPNTVVQQESGASAADIRGENTNNTLIVRMPYGRIDPSISSISDLEDGTVVTIKSGIEFTLDNGVFFFAEDVKLIYNAGAASFVKYVEPQELTIATVSFIGNENDKIGLYRITLADEMESVASVAFATPNTVVQQESGASAADIRGENTNNTLIVRMPYGRIDPNISSIADLDDGTIVTIKSGVNFTLDNGIFYFAEDVELIYNEGAASFVKYVEPIELSISSVAFLGLDGGNAAIGLYRITLDSAMPSAAGNTTAPRGLTVQSNGVAVADIRGEGANNSLIIRMPYGLIKQGATAISDLDDGTRVLIKSGIEFTLDNGIFYFAEDVELIYNEGAASFVKYVEPQEISIMTVSFVGNENDKIGLYRITLADAMASVAGLTFATPNTVVQQENGASAADIRGENSDNTLIIRMPYGRIDPNISSIADLDDGTIVTIKSGVNFTLDNGIFYFAEDVELIYNEGAASFVKYVEPQELSVASVSFIGLENDNAAIGLYRISLETPMSSIAGITTAPRGLTIQSNGVAVADIRGENTDGSLILRMPYGLIKQGATSISDLDDDTRVLIKSGVKFVLDNGIFYFTEDFELVYNEGAASFVKYVEPQELSIMSVEFIGNENDLVGLYRITLAYEMESVAGLAFATPNTVVQQESSASAADIRGENTNNTLIVRMPYGRIDPDISSIADLDDGTIVTIKSGINFTLDNGIFYFAEDFELVYYEGAASFVKYVELQELSIETVEFLGLEGNNAAIGLYRISLGTPMNTAAGLTSARGLFVQSNGVPAADIRGENTTDSLILRMPYGLIKQGATSISDLDDDTRVLLKSGLKFVLDNGIFYFAEDYELVYYEGSSLFVKYVEPQELTIETIEFLGLENNSPAIGLYRIALGTPMNTAAGLTSARGLFVQSNGVPAADIRGENTTDSLILRVPYGLIKQGATSITGLDDGTMLLIKANKKLTLDNGIFYFAEDYELVYHTGSSIFVKYIDPVPPEIIVDRLELHYNQGETLSYMATVTDNRDVLSADDICVQYPNGAIDDNGCLLPGSWVIRFYAVDSENNIGYSEEYSITVLDILDPIIELSGETVYEAGTEYVAGSTLSLNVNVYDIGGTATYEVVIEDGFVIDGCLQVGVWNLKIIATDSVGHTAEESIIITVQDTTAPEIIISKNNKIKYLIGNVPSFSIIARDSYEGIIDVEYLYPDGIIDEDGKFIIAELDVPVQVKAVDSSGNQKIVTLNIDIFEKDDIVPEINYSGKTEYIEGELLEIYVLGKDNFDDDINVEIIKPEGMEDSEGKLRSGEWDIILRAIDTSENETRLEVKVKVNEKEPITPSTESCSCSGQINMTYGFVVVFAAVFLLILRRKRSK